MSTNSNNIRQIFEKDITRDIQGVIKIGQENDSTVFEELDEYIVTKDTNKLFSDFLEGYKQGVDRNTDKMGVWISGFFGSGKSHFLKILSYLLDDRTVHGKRAVEFFANKIQDPSMLADISRIGQISTDVMLFNIDSKADADSKNSKEAIIKVFSKVFDENLGFCGSIPWLADLERQLAKDGNYEAFKEKFKSIAGSAWENSREDIYFEADNVVEALVATTKMTEETVRTWFDKAEANYSINIEKFAKRVNEYVESKPRGHHVVFLVDEIGQYVGEDSSLMLNLQTVVEDLGTYCAGRAWVIVTSQEAIDAITKNMRSNANNFSKIMGRFNTRLKFDSTYVDEVIKMRLLAKTKDATDSLKMTYDQKSALLNNLIQFSSDTPEMKKYKNVQDFIEVYPFVPYQFHLVQKVFTGIRENRMTGAHLSQGERSLLNAFQESAKEYGNCQIGTLVPFNSFYNTIESFLEGNIRMVIKNAEDNEELELFDVEVLKILFMIKHVKEMPSKVENLTTLMISQIDEDVLELSKRIEAALVRLRKQTLVQKNGEEYDFLTNEEQDVNKEIQNIAVEVEERIQKVGEEIFDGLLSDIKKFRYGSKYYFDYNKMIDDKFYSVQKYDITLRMLTPYFDSGEELNEHALKMMSVKDNQLIVKLPNDISYLEEIKSILQINTYILRNAGKSSNPMVEEIKVRKQREVADRKKRVVEALIDALKIAEIYAGGQKLSISEKSPVDRINEGFDTLIRTLYSKLGYIEHFIESQKDLAQIMLDNGGQIAWETDEELPNALALKEVDGLITRHSDRHIPTTVKGITDTYGKAPFGWREEDTLGLLLRLFKAQEVTLELSNEYLRPNDPELLKYVTKKEYTDRILVKKRSRISVTDINNAKELARELFNQTATPPDEDGLMNRFKELAKDELELIKGLLVNYQHNKYPGKQILEEGKKLFEELQKLKEVKLFYDFLRTRKEDLLEFEEDVYDIKKFFGHSNEKGDQMKHFENALKMIEIFKGNETYVIDPEARKLISEIKDIVQLPSPYFQIPNLPMLIEKFRLRFVDLLTMECEPIKETIDNDQSMIMEEVAAYHIPDNIRSELKKEFDSLKERLEKCNNFFEAVAMKEESDRLKLRCVERIQKEIPKTPEVEPPISGGGNENSPEGKNRPVLPPRPPVKVVKPLSFKNIFNSVKTLDSTDDIDKFLEEVRAKLVAELEENVRLKLS